MKYIVHRSLIHIFTMLVKNVFYLLNVYHNKNKFQGSKSKINPITVLACVSNFYKLLLK